MAWTISLTQDAENQLAELDNSIRRRIKDYIDNRISNHPDPIKLTESLKGNLSGYRRFRVGDYRLISQFDEIKMSITLVFIENRRDVYQSGRGRL